MPTYTQENRLISLSTPLGTDVLLLAGFTGHEAISRLFSFNLDLLGDPSTPVDFNQIIGQNVTINVTQQDNTPRHFNGVVSRFAQSGKDSRFIHYQMEVVPWLWMLTRNASCQIFHWKSVKDIIEQIFSQRGFTDFSTSKLIGTYNPMEFTVQYRETDFNFVSRLMEQNGIFYYFEHTENQHTLILADDRTAHEQCPGQGTASMNLASGALDAGDVINSWNFEQELKTGKYTLTDYNFKTPSANLQASEPTVCSVGNNSRFEIFDYPGEYLTRGDGTAVSKLRMQEEEAGHKLISGSSFCRSFTTGYKFTLAEHYQDSMNADYVLTEIQHVASVAGNYSLDQAGTGDTYSNQFSCIPADVQFRPARITPKSLVQGPQTATVIGKSAYSADTSNDSDTDISASSGEEIWVDKFGRVIVRFPWDREGNCSCLVRVAQQWAGQGWGGIVIPRVGQEVIVSFLEGDPDRPIIIGCVYNADMTTPYKLPDNQTRSTFMTRSSEGGGASNYNELRFEDKMGSEQVFIRGEMDFDTRIKNDSREWIGNNLSLMVAQDQMEKIGSNYHCQVGQNSSQKIGENLSIQVGQNLYEKSGQNFAHEAGQMIHLKGGMTVVIEAGMELTLKAGSNFIDIGPAGIAISGTPMVMINSGGSAGSGCGSSPTDPKDPDEADDGSKGTKMN